MSDKTPINHAEVANKVTPKVIANVRKDIPSMIKPHVDRLGQRIMSKVGHLENSEKEQDEVAAGLKLVSDVSRLLDDPGVTVLMPRDHPERLSVQREVFEGTITAVRDLDPSTLLPNPNGNGAFSYMVSTDPSKMVSYTAASEYEGSFGFVGVMTVIPGNFSPGTGNPTLALSGILHTLDNERVVTPVGRLASTNGNLSPWYVGASATWAASGSFKYRIVAMEPGDVGEVSLTTYSFESGSPVACHTAISGVANGSLLQAAATSRSITDGFGILISSPDGAPLVGKRFKLFIGRETGDTFTHTVCPGNMHNHSSNLVGDASANRMNVEAAAFVITANPNKNLIGGWSVNADARSFPALTWTAENTLYKSIGNSPIDFEKFPTNDGTSGFVLPYCTRLKSSGTARDEHLRFGSYDACDIETSYGTSRSTIQAAQSTGYLTNSTKSTKVMTPGSNAMWAYSSLLRGRNIWENPTHRERLAGLRKKAREHVEGVGAAQLSPSELLKQKVFTEKNAKRLRNGAIDLAELIL